MTFGLELLALASAVAGLGVLIILSVIDLKVWLLPNKYVLLFAILGVIFHSALSFQLMTPPDMLYGLLLGGGLLYLVRMGGNAYYKQDTLGLGDVKLLAAAGLWLGVEGVVLALTAGAFVGLLHGIAVALTRAVKEKTKPNLNRLMIPAGPGFCVGIVASWFYIFAGYWGS